MIIWLYLTRFWQRRTFGRSKDVKGAIKHLRKEIGEIEDPFHSPTEYADVVFLVWQIAHRNGVSPFRFMALLWTKLIENAFYRDWPEPVDGEPCEHFKSDPRL